MFSVSLIGTRGLRAAAAAILCLTGLIPAAAGAAEQRFSEATEVTVVEIPVQVVRDGQPVRGLTAADFEVYQGRDKQPVTGFEVLDLAAASNKPEAARRLPMSARRRFVLLFDLGFSKPNSLGRARDAARDLLSRSFHPADLIAVAAYLPAKGPQFLLGFTSDRTAVLAALDRLDPKQNPQALAGGGFDMSGDPLMLGGGIIESAGSHRETGRERAEEATGGDKGNEGSVGLPDGIDPFRTPLERAERDQQRQGISQFTRALGAFADTLATVRGRKYVVLLSEGFESSAALGTTDEDEMLNMDTHSVRGDVWNIDSDRRFGNAKASADLERMLEELRRADCAVQAVDIGGLRTNPEDVHASRARGADGLALMANATGGEFYPNFNNLSAAMDKMLERTSVTYVLSIQPDVKRDGQYHKLRVELKDGKAGRVVYRPGFYAPKPFSQETRLERTLQTAGELLSGQEGGPIGVSVLAAPFKVEGPKAYVPVLIEIDGNSLIAANGTGNVLPAEVYVYALDDQGKVVDFFTQTVGLDLAKVGEAVKKTGIKFYGDLDLPAGSYALRVLVRNATSGAAGLRVASLDVPAFAQASPVLLSPFFPEPVGRWLMLHEAKTRQGEVAYPFMAQNQPYIPASRPALEPGKAAAMALVGYHLGAGQLQAQAMVMTAEGKEAGEGKIAVLGRETPSAGGPDRLKATFQPPSLPPGEYLLLVTLTDAQGVSETSTASFVVAGTAAAAGGPAR